MTARSESSPGSGANGAGLTAPFRPRAARWVSGALAVLVAVATVLLLALLPGTGLSGYGALDRSGFALLGIGVVWFCWRQATVRAVPVDGGLRVRNLATTRTVEWAEIVSVRFGQGRPWVQLDLADGDTLAVMGIQRADGEFADAQARRLATLVARATRTARDD
ncbi:PH domain-containing protein [Cellulomonas sp. NPDC089187]|uniref:PH domain-containing protein n=1 Tax=Cellulomonas sp. NPDC089187 TaxID=3154970 RepID=UPI0034412534